MICLGAVSAAENIDVNATDTAQDTLELSEISDADVSSDNGGEEQLSSSSAMEIRDKDTQNKGTINVEVGTTVTIQSNAPYDSAYYYIYKATQSDFSDRTAVESYLEMRTTWEDKHTETFTSEGTYYFRAYNSQDRYGVYSNVLTYVVGSSSGGETPVEPSEIMKLKDKDSGNYSTISIAQGTTVTVQASAPTDYYYNLQLSSDEDFTTYSTIADSMTLGTSWADIATRTFSTAGTYYLRLYQTNDRNGIYSNVLTYIVGDSSSEASATLAINDNSYPSNSTIYYSEKYTANIYFTLTKSGSLSDESIEVFLDGTSVGNYTAGTAGKLCDVEIDTSKNHNIYAVYTANGGEMSKTSNTINYVYAPVQASATLSINDHSYPSNSTIYFTGESYSSDIYYTLDKTGTFADESLELYVDGSLEGTYTLTNAKITTLSLDNSASHTVYAVYKAAVNGESFTIKSNTLTFIPQATESGAQINIRDSESYKTGTISISSQDECVIAFDYYLVKESDSVAMEAVYLYVNDIYIEGSMLESLTYNSFKTFGNLKINETGTYVIKLKYEYNTGILNMEHVELYSNEITYQIKITNSSQSDQPEDKKTPLISANADVNDNSVSISITLPANATGNVTVTLSNSQSQNKVLLDGSASVTFYNLAAGDYTYTVNYSGDDTYNTVSTKGGFKIQDAADQSKTATEITVSPTVVSRGSDITISLVDTKGNRLSNQILTLIIDGERQNRALTNGAVILNSLDVGNHTLYVNFNGDDEYLASSLNTTVTVNSLVNTDELADIYDGSQFKLTFYDENGNPLANKEVIFTINGNDYYVNTSFDGVAVLKLSLSAGTYSVNIIHPVTQEVFTATVSVVYKLSADNVNVDYSYSKNFKVTLLDKNSNPISDASITITINGKTYNLKTNSKGVATYKINGLLPKTYQITAEYNGAKITKNVVVKQILKAKKAKYKRYGLKVYKATLKTSQGKAIKGKKISFKFKGKTYKAKTNKKGVAKIKIKKFWKVGKFKIKIKYLKTSIKKTITVKR